MSSHAPFWPPHPGGKQNLGPVGTPRMGQANSQPSSTSTLAAIPPVHLEPPTHRCHAVPCQAMCLVARRPPPLVRSFSTQTPHPGPGLRGCWAEVLRPQCTRVPLRPHGLLDIQIYRLCPERSSLSTDLGICMFNKHCGTDPSLGEGTVKYKAKGTS